jgi:hypothetical protein
MSIKPTYTKTCMGFIQLPLMGWGVLILGTIVLILGISLKVQSSRLHAEKEAHESTRLQYRTFVSEVKRVGEAAAKKAKAQEAADRKRKEAADNETKTLRNNLAAARKRLRDNRNSPAGSLLPPDPSGSPSPERAAFNRAELDRALRAFEEGIEGLIIEGDEARMSLDTAKRWVREQGKP